MRTLLGWYQAGLDVEARLPRLSTYLGHVAPSSTYWYLSATPALMALMRQIFRSRRFYARGGKGLSFEDVFGEPVAAGRAPVR